MKIREYIIVKQNTGYTAKPVITLFSVPATSASLTVPVTAFTAIDSVGVTGYLITDSSTPPDVFAVGWAETPPVTVVYTTQGTKTIYAWAKNGAGNVSDAWNAQVVIEVPSMDERNLFGLNLPAADVDARLNHFANQEEVLAGVVFDFRGNELPTEASAPARYILTKDDRNIIKVG
jgi:hypothetical protein